VERSEPKLDEAQLSGEWEVAERERSGERGLQK